MPKKMYFDKEEMKRLRLEEKKTLKEMAKILKSNPITIKKNLDLYGIEVIHPNVEYSLIAKLNLSDDEFKNVLVEEYINKEKSINKISQYYKVSPCIIRKYLKRYNIPLRDHKKSNKVCNRGGRSGHWKGGRIKNDSGYVLIYQENHPSSNARKYIYEHRLVMEKELGRYLKKNEHVHHINFKTDDNRIENLQLLTSQEHQRLHANLRKPKGKSGIKHIHWCSRDELWNVKFKGKYRGCYKNIEDAKDKLKSLYEGGDI